MRLRHDACDPERVIPVLPQNGVVLGHRSAGCAYWGVGHATDFVSRYWSKPASPFWRPMPLCL